MPPDPYCRANASGGYPTNHQVTLDTAPAEAKDQLSHILRLAHKVRIPVSVDEPDIMPITESREELSA